MKKIVRNSIFLFSIFVLSIVVFSSCAVVQSPGESPRLDSTTWQLTAIEKRPVSFGDKATIQFDEAESKVSGKAVCNSYFGEYERIKNKISFSDLGSTKMFCEGKMDEEQQIISNLQKTNRYEIKLGILYLYAGETLVLTFKK